MAKHGSVKLYLFLIGCALVSVETPTAIAQVVPLSTPTYTFTIPAGSSLGTTNSAPLTNITVQTTQTITNDSNGPVWQTVWTVRGTNGLIAVFAQTTTSVRATMSLSPPVGMTITGMVGSGFTMFSEDLLSPPPACGDMNTPDSDNDGLPDSVENCIGTDPNNPDTDGDGYTDLQEVVLGTDPFDSCSYPSIPLNLLAWWTFDDAGGTLATDASGNLQTGVLEGSPSSNAIPTWVTNGVANGALSFDGSNSFLVAPATAMFCNLTTQITVSAWINAQNQLAGGGPPIVKWNGYSVDDTYSPNAEACGFSLELHDLSNVWFLVYSTDLGAWISTPLAPVPTNQWTHVVGVYDGSAVRIYTNGASAGSTTTNIGAITLCGTDLAIGTDLVNADRYYHGLMDDVRVYYTALSTTDVYALYKMDTDHDGLANIDEINIYHTNPNLFDSHGDGYSDGQTVALGIGTNNVPPYLLGWWQFLDGTGSLDVDSSSNGVTGWLVNSPTWMTSGVIGGALQFDGSASYVINPVSTFPVLSTQLTVAVWIDLPNQNPYGADPIIKWNQCSANGDIGGFTLEFSGATNILFYLYSTSATNWIPTATTAITSNTWTHLAVTYDGSYLRMYQNGVAVGSPSAFTDSVNVVAAPIAVAHDLINSARYLTGQVADVRVYDKALGSNDVAAIYNTDSIGDGIPNWWRQEYFGNGTTTNSYSCASCTSTNPWAYDLTNLQVYQNPSVLISNNYTTFNDGIPDWWRVMYFNTTITDSLSCASCDPTGDGLSNLQKYQDGLNPLVAYSISAPSMVISYSTGNSASMPDLGGGASYSWSIINGTITSATNAPTVTWTAGDAGIAGLTVTMETTNSGASPFTGNAQVSVTPCSLSAVILTPPEVRVGSTNIASVPGPPTALTILTNFDGSPFGTEPFGGLVAISGTNYSGDVYSFCGATSDHLLELNSSGTIVWSYDLTSIGGLIFPVSATFGVWGGPALLGVTANSDDCDDVGECGTVFAVVFEAGIGVLHQFNGTDGALPEGPLMAALDGHFYGTTVYGGTNDDGVIYRVDISGGGSFKVVHQFSGADGAYPYDGLIQGGGADTHFYGTTSAGGTYGGGTAFKLQVTTTLTNFMTLHSFGNGDDGSTPMAGLIRGSDGNFYGTTEYGGTSNDGTVFKITSSGTLTVVHSFTGGSGGAYPTARLMQAADGYFYGTTMQGVGDSGTVFRVSSNGSFAVVSPCPNNTYLASELVQGTSGLLLGTTTYGGPGGVQGNLYEINPAMYTWSIVNGMILGPTNTPSIQWTPTGTGTVNICLTISDFSACTTQICTTVIAYTGAIAAGGDHSLAILTNGSLWAWGEDDHGQLGDGESSDEVTPEPVGDPLCGLPSLSNAVALAAGSDFSIAIDNNGLVWTWGDGSDDNGGELGNGGGTNTSIPASINLSNVVAVAAGHSHALALRADGTVWAWGSDVDDDGDDNQGVLGVGSFFADLGSYSTNMPVESLIPSGAYITSIAAGNYWSLALDSYGRVWGWGNNANGQLGISPDVLLTTNVPVLISGISNVVAVAAGWQHAIAITADKTLWTWGHNGSGELGQGSTFSYSTSPIQVVASGLSNNVVAIAGGNQFTLAVTSNGQLFAFGSNNHSQLGTNNGGALIPAPTLVAGISNVVLASAPPMTEDGNGCHSLAVAFGQGTSQYYGWGYDSDGQAGCGLAEDDDQYTPARIPFCNACSSCVQLGTSNVFTAQCTGTLKLYFNDDYYYNDNYGEYIVTITGLGLTSNVTVSALASNGVAVGIVSNGVTYTCVASGWCNSGDLPSCTNTNIPCGCDPNGKFSDTGEPPFECPASATYGMTKAVCPYLQCLSLVGRIE